MENVHLVTFATGNCVKGQNKIISSAKEHGFLEENVHSFSHDDYKNNPVVMANQHIFKERKGVGYWAWKPIFILEVMKKLKFGDVVVYHDSGRPCYDWKFSTRVEPFVDLVKSKYQGVGVVFGPFKHGPWTKHDCMELMDCDHDNFKRHNQASATWSIWEKNVTSVTILNEWLKWMTHHARIVTDDKSILGQECENFKHHRHDQSILTNILLKLHFDGKYKNIMRSHGIYEKNINKIGNVNIEKSGLK
tara:strand:+ start:117 stop:860 length:744 start_codon:yes stop_codon:yes gene_type:complete